MKTLVFTFALLLVTLITPSYADDMRCNHPPYGGSPDRYRAILETYGHRMESVTRTLAGICNMKFGDADRSELHKLGFNDEEINSSDTSTLAVDMLNGFRGQPAAK
jgi:hypothetical protein